MLAVERKDGMNLQMQSALTLNKKLRRLTTTEVLNILLKNIQKLRWKYYILRENFIKLQKLPFQAALGYI